MATPFLDIATTEEKLIWWGMVLTYPCFFIGGLYVLGCVIGWLIFGVLMLRFFIEGRTPNYYTPPIIWVWVLGMFMMLVALLIAHFDRGLGMGQTIKSSIGWAKGWALLALFPFLGALVPFKKEMLIRACCVVATCSLVFAFITIPPAVVGFSGDIFLSPLKAIGGPGEDFFKVRLFGINPETGKPRWSFFGPWAPSAGLLACIYLVICWQEKNQFWRNCGLAGALMMCLLCQSRAGWALFMFLLPVLFVLDKNIHAGWFIFLGILLACLIVLGQPVYEMVMDSYQQVKDSRPDSTRVRNALAEIAVQRWRSEAPVWGHGIIERGPKLVEFMPIGTHHSWYGLLFTKGWVGAISLGIPMFVTVVYLLMLSIHDTDARIALTLVLVLLGYSFFENLEILVYLYWPALIWLGMALSPIKNAKHKMEMARKNKRKLRQLRKKFYAEGKC